MNVSLKHAPRGVMILGAALLAGCTMNGPSNFEVHEALFYGGTQERVGWVYGGLSGASTTVRLGSQNFELRAQVQNDPLALAGTLSVNGNATFRTPTATMTPKIAVSRDFVGGNYTVQANSAVESVYATDGRTWFKLTDRLAAGATVSVTPRNSVSLRGAGRLTDAEADALGAVLAAQGTLAVAVLPENTLPDAALTFEPAPRAYLRTGLYVQRGISTAVSIAPNAPAGATVSVRELSRGTNSAYSSETSSVVLSRSAADLQSVFRTVGGNSVPAPAAPIVDFTNNSVATFFLGSRPTGGYGVRLLNATGSGDTLTLTVEVTTPRPDSIVTQAFTSPYVSVQVAGAYSRVLVRDAAGRVLAQSN